MTLLKEQDGLTPRDDTKKRASEVLKRVDLLLRQGDLEGALTESRRVKEIDPRNVYALAFEERILNLLDQREKETARKAHDTEADTARRLEEEARARLEKERKAAELREIARREAARRIADQKATAVPTPPTAPSLQRVSPAPPAADTSLLDGLRRQMDAFTTYRTALVEVWQDGAAQSDEQQWLAVLRETLAIGHADHSRLEHEVQLECYLNALKRALALGHIKPENASLLTEMRQNFQISAEDHDRIEARLLAEIQSTEKQLDRIALIDDDVKLLEVISDLLRDAGFATLPFTTTDEAYAYLRSGQAPDLILCDVNLETSTMGGFSFYEKIQWLEHLHDVPFIFLTGLTDEVLIRTGKELGVDDYLTKPISEQTLVATIKGKLKRFKRLKQRKA
ncbi:MAG: response regulator [Bacteroidetes bacterium]|jgi:CheY-like chemotaxis protein|nr:response regulator [Bacteroidota bacterium]